MCIVQVCKVYLHSYEISNANAVRKGDICDVGHDGAPSSFLWASASAVNIHIRIYCHIGAQRHSWLSCIASPAAAAAVKGQVCSSFDSWFSFIFISLLFWVLRLQLENTWKCHSLVSNVHLLQSQISHRDDLTSSAGWNYAFYLMKNDSSGWLQRHNNVFETFL